MATIYKATCKNCSNEEKVLWGDGLFYVQYQCTNCLKTVAIPRHAPRPNREGREVPKFLEKVGFYSYPPTPTVEIRRFTEAELKEHLSNHLAWQNGDDEWDESEVLKILQIMCCDCYASLERVSKDSSPSAKCDSCNSVNLQMELEKLAD